MASVAVTVDQQRTPSGTSMKAYKYREVDLERREGRAPPGHVTATDTQSTSGNQVTFTITDTGAYVAHATVNGIQRYVVFHYLT